MKKKYNAPQIHVVKMETSSLLAGSDIPVGGSGTPKAREYDMSDD